MLCAYCKKVYAHASHQRNCILGPGARGHAPVADWPARTPPQAPPQQGPGSSSATAAADGGRLDVKELAGLLRDCSSEQLFRPATTCRDLPGGKQVQKWYDLMNEVFRAYPAAKTAGGDALEDWFKLFSVLPRIVFGPETDRNGHAASGELVRQRLSDIMVAVGAFKESLALPEKVRPPPWSGVQQQQQHQQHQHQHQHDEESGGARLSKQQIRQVTKLMVSGNVSRAAEVLSGAMAPITKTRAMADQLRQQFPTAVPAEASIGQGEQDTAGFDDMLHPAPVFTVEDIGDAIKNLAPGTSTGLLGWRVEYINHADINDGVVKLLVPVFNDIAAGNLPVSVKPYFMGGRLVPIPKEGRPEDLRSLGVGDLFPKLVAQAMLGRSTIKNRISELFLQHRQFGVGVAAGAETLIHTIRALLQGGGTPTGSAASDDLASDAPVADSGEEPVLLKVDFVNAYNTMSRVLIRRMLLQYFPEFVRIFDARYPLRTPGPRVCVDGIVDDADGPSFWFDMLTGVQQGDPFGPFFFALGLLCIFQQMQTSLGVGAGASVCFSGAFLDDVFLVGTPTNVKRVAEAFIAACNTTGSGMGANLSKFALYPDSADVTRVMGPRAAPDAGDNQAQQSSGPGVINWAKVKRVPASEGVKVLGAPVGDPGWCSRFWIDNFNKGFRPLLDHLPLLPSRQDRLLILRHCVVTKSMFMLRTTHPNVVFEAAELIDYAVRDILLTMLPTYHHGGQPHLTPEMILQSRLPLRKAGLGLHSAQRVRKVAFISSFVDAVRTASSLKIPAVTQALQLMFENGVTAAADGYAELEAAGEGLRQSSVLEMVQQLKVDWEAAVADGLITRAAVAYRLRDLPTTFAQVLDSTTRKLQHKLVGILQRIDYGRLSASITKKGCAQISAWFKSVSSKGAMDLFSAFPTEPALRVPNKPFALKLATALGSSAMLDHYAKPAGNCPATCRNGRNHVFNCRKGGSHIARHDLVKKEVHQMVRAAGLSVSLEPRAQHEGMGKGAPDMEVRGFPTADRNSFFEVSIVNPCQHSLVASAAVRPLSAAAEIESRKCNKYAKEVERNHRLFFPTIIETTGALGPCLIHLLKSIEECATANNGPYRPKRTGWASPSFRMYWRQRISVALALGAYGVAERIAHDCVPELGNGRGWEAHAHRSAHPRPSAAVQSQASNQAGSAASSAGSA